MTDEQALDLRDALRRAELQRDEALNQLAALRTPAGDHAALVAEVWLAAMADSFWVDAFTRIYRTGEHWIVRRCDEKDFDGSGYLHNGRWNHNQSTPFESLAAAFAALDAVRADKGSK